MKMRWYQQSSQGSRPMISLRNKAPSVATSAIIHAAKRRYQRGSERCVAIVIKLQSSMDDSKKIGRPHNGRGERHGARDHLASASARSEARRVGKEGVSTCKSRWLR